LPSKRLRKMGVEKEDPSVKAQVLRSFGDPSNFELTELPKPEAHPGTVLIRRLSPIHQKPEGDFVG
jgi:hypothetical protein